MADYKSSEGTRKPVEGINQRIGDTPSKKVTTLECMECGYREVFTERQFKFTDGLSCYVCNGPVQPVLTRPGEKIRNRRMKKHTILGADFSSGKDFTVETYFDMNGTIKGLKAIQREAKKATATLKELDNIKKHTCPECKTISLDINTLTADGGVYSINQLCKNCGWSNIESNM